MVNRRVPRWPVEAGELATVPMLSRLPGGRLNDLAAAHPARGYRAGEILLRQGAPATRLLILLNGQATAVTSHADGTRSRYPLMTAPCVLDKAAVLDGAGYPATWTAVTAARALALSATQFRALLADQRVVREHVLHYLAVQVSRTRAALSTRAVGPAVTQITHWLLTASGPDTGAVVWLPAGQQGIAEELGLSRVTVNRTLQQLARTGAIRIRPRAITILDPAKLASQFRWDAGLRPKRI